MPSSGSTAANAVRLAALSALLAAAVLQLRKLRRLKADLHRAEVRASLSCCLALPPVPLAFSSAASRPLSCCFITLPILCQQEEARFAAEERRAERAGRVKAEVGMVGYLAELRTTVLSGFP